jgi:hypothetical protein
MRWRCFAAPGLVIRLAAVCLDNVVKKSFECIDTVLEIASGLENGQFWSRSRELAVRDEIHPDKAFHLGVRA